MSKAGGLLVSRAFKCGAATPSAELPSRRRWEHDDDDENNASRRVATLRKHAMRKLGLKSNEITLINHTDRDLIVFVSPSADGLQLKSKKVFNEMGFDAGQAGVAHGRASTKHEYEYEAPADQQHGQQQHRTCGVV